MRARARLYGAEKIGSEPKKKFPPGDFGVCLCPFCEQWLPWHFDAGHPNQIGLSPIRPSSHFKTKEEILWPSEIYHPWLIILLRLKTQRNNVDEIVRSAAMHAPEWDKQPI